MIFLEALSLKWNSGWWCRRDGILFTLMWATVCAVHTGLKEMKLQRKVIFFQICFVLGVLLHRDYRRDRRLGCKPTLSIIVIAQAWGCWSVSSASQFSFQVFMSSTSWICNAFIFFQLSVIFFPPFIYLCGACPQSWTNYVPCWGVSEGLKVSQQTLCAQMREKKERRF